MAAGDEDLDELSANESGRSGHERRRPNLGCHVGQCEAQADD
jgi:hypothetical protein